MLHSLTTALRPVASFTASFTVGAMLPLSAPLVLAVVTAIPMLCASNASAQSNQMPTPATAAQLEELLKAVGLTGSARDSALRLHEEYFASFREFEEREVAQALESMKKGDFDIGITSDEADRDTGIRRRLLQRAAQIDSQYVDSLIGTLNSDDALRAEKLRSALSRRRSGAFLRNFGLGGRSSQFDLRAAPIFASLEASNQTLIAPTFDSYDAELTRLWERFAEASLARAAKVARLREEAGIGATPISDAEAAVAEGAAAEGVLPAVDEWFAKMSAIRSEAGKDSAEATKRIRRLHRDTLMQIEPLLSADVAAGVRSYLVNTLYPTLFTKSDFNATLEIAQRKRDAKEIDDSTWSAVEGIIEAHRSSARGLIESVMDAADALKSAAPAEDNMIFFSGSDDSNQPDSSVQDARLEEWRMVDTRDADALRAAIGMGVREIAPQTASALSGRGLPEGMDVQIGEAIGGLMGEAMGEAMGGASMVVMGSNGEATLISGEDLADSGMMFFGGPNSASRLPRPMDRDALEYLAQCANVDADARAAFDAIVGECTDARAKAAELVPSPQQEITSSDGSFSISISLDGENPEPAISDDVARATEMIATAEDVMFDSIKALADTSHAECVEGARRVRARERLTNGERGASTIDLVVIARNAALSAQTRLAIASDLDAWDLASVNALRSMRAEINAGSNERAAILKQATKHTDVSGDGTNVSHSTSIEMGDDLSRRMMAADRRIEKAREAVATVNKSAAKQLVESAAIDPHSQTVLRRAINRALFTTIYTAKPTLDGVFTKAKTILAEDAAMTEVLAALQAEWTESREVRCDLAVEESIAAQIARDAQAKPADDQPFAGMGGMQERTRERKQIRGDLDQIDATMFHRVVDLVTGAVGAEKAKELGELPTAKKSRAPMTIQLGG